MSTDSKCPNEMSRRTDTSGPSLFAIHVWCRSYLACLVQINELAVTPVCERYISTDRIVYAQSGLDQDKEDTKYAILTRPDCSDVHANKFCANPLHRAPDKALFS